MELVLVYKTESELLFGNTNMKLIVALLASVALAHAHCEIIYCKFYLVMN